MSWPKIDYELSDDILVLPLNLSEEDYYRNRPYGYSEGPEENINDETFRRQLIEVFRIIRGGVDTTFEVYGARIYAYSPLTGQVLKFGVGDTFGVATDLQAIVESWHSTSISVSYDWEQGHPQQRICFAAELMISAQEGKSILGERWFQIVGEQLVPFDSEERQTLLKRVGSLDGMGRRIEKWKQELQVPSVRSTDDEGVDKNPF